MKNKSIKPAPDTQGSFLARSEESITVTKHGQWKLHKEEPTNIKQQAAIAHSYKDKGATAAAKLREVTPDTSKPEESTTTIINRMRENAKPKQLDLPLDTPQKKDTI